MHTPFFPAWLPRLAPMRAPKVLIPRLRRATLAQIETILAPALPSDLLQKPASGAHSREKIFPLSRTFWCWIWQVLQVNASCREVVGQVQALFSLEGRGQVDEATGAYCCARSKIRLDLLQRALSGSAASAQRLAKATLGLQGRPLKVLDGTSVRLANSAANRKKFPPPKNVPAGCGFPLLKIVVLFCLASGALLAHATGNQFVHEVRLAEALRTYFTQGDILIADRAYGLFPVLAWLQSLGVDAIARVPTRLRRVDFRKAKKRFRPGEGLFVWKKANKASAFLPLTEWQALPDQILVRIIRVRVERSGFRSGQWTLATTLLDESLYPTHEIVAAYARRWRLEMCLDDLKTSLGMAHLRCLTPERVQKELLVFLITHNLLRWVMLQAAQEAEVNVERISFKGSLDRLRQWAQAFAQVGKSKRRAQKRAQLWQGLLRSLAADLVPERPGRKEPRAVKRRDKYPYLNCPRKRFRERFSRNKRRSWAIARKKAALI